MNETKAAVSRCDSQMTAGLCAAVAALVIAMEEAGAVSRTRFNQILRNMKTKLPKELAGGRRDGPRRASGTGFGRKKPNFGKTFTTEQVRPAQGDGSGHKPLLGVPFAV